MIEHSRFWYWAGKASAYYTARVMGRAKVYDRDRLPATGPVIVVSNHLSHLDPPLLSRTCSRHVAWMAKEELYQWPLGWYLNKVAAFPVKRGSGDRTALRRAFEILEGGDVLGIFPEGHRSEDGRLMVGEDGVGLIAMRSRAVIQPIGLMGTEQILHPHSPLLHFGRVVIRFGVPYTLDDLYDSRGRDAITEATRRIMASIAALLEPRYLPLPVEQDAAAC